MKYSNGTIVKVPYSEEDSDKPATVVVGFVVDVHKDTRLVEVSQGNAAFYTLEELDKYNRPQLRLVK